MSPLSSLGLATDIVSLCLLGPGVILSATVATLLLRSRNKNKLRSRMLISLFISHFWSNALFLGFIAASLAGHSPKTGSTRCYVSTFLVETALWTEYLFTIAVAIASYCMLLYPLSPATLNLERYWYLVNTGAYVISLGLGGVETGVDVTSNDSGLCSGGPTAKIFTLLVAFVPRCIVFIVIVAIYVRIHLFLRRHKHITNLSRGAGKCTGTSQSIPARAQQEDANNTTPIPPVPSAEWFESQIFEISPWETLYLPGLSDTLLIDGETGTTTDEVHARPIPSISLEHPSSWISTLASDDTSSSYIPACGNAGLSPAPHHSLSETPSPQSTSAPSITVTSAPEIQFARSSIELPTPSNLSSQQSSTPSLPDRPQAPPLYHRRTFRDPNDLFQEKLHEERIETLHELFMRKAAIMFLLFPLTYFVLTAFSMARLIWHYASPQPSMAMEALAEWGLFLQAPLDALTFGLAATLIKRTVEREIKDRRGTEP